MNDLKYYIKKNQDNLYNQYITYKEYLQEKKSIILSYKISIKKYNTIEKNL